MELSGKVIIFEDADEAEKWFKLISDVKQDMMYTTARIKYENDLKYYTEVKKTE